MHILTQLTFDSADEYQKFCAVMAEANLDAGKPVKPAKEPTPAPAAKPAAKKPEKTAPSADTEEDDGDADAAVDEKEADESDAEANVYDKAKELVLEVSEKKGKAAAKRALAAIGIEKINPNIEEKKLHKLIAACQKELA